MISIIEEIRKLESKKLTRHKFDSKNVLVVTLGITCLVLAIITINTHIFILRIDNKAIHAVATIINPGRYTTRRVTNNRLVDQIEGIKVQYTDEKGKEITKELKITSKKIPLSKAGSKIEIVYFTYEDIIYDLRDINELRKNLKRDYTTSGILGIICVYLYYQVRKWRLKNIENTIIP